MPVRCLPVEGNIRSLQWNPLAFRISEAPPLNTPRGWHACDIISTHWDLILPHPKHQQKKHFKTKCLGLSETRIRPNLMIYHHWGYTGIPIFYFQTNPFECYKSIIQIWNVGFWPTTKDSLQSKLQLRNDSHATPRLAPSQYHCPVNQLRQLSVESFRFSFRIFFTKHG